VWVTPQKISAEGAIPAPHRPHSP